MSDPPSPGSPSPFDRPPDDRLDSWKEIAAYMKRDVTTVQRWEKREGMPVHRHVHDKMGSVYAFRTDLDAWAGRRSPALVDEAVQTGPRPGEERPAAERGFSGTWSATSSRSPALQLKRLPPRRRDAARPVAGSWRQRGRSGRGADDLAVPATRPNPGESAGECTIWSLTDFDGTEQAAVVSRDGRYAAFLSFRDGQMDLWLTQVGSGEFQNPRGAANGSS